jgi:ACR3 family arsenite efflux pump ArsB
VTLFVNWIVKPFSMALIAWLFFRQIFSGWISASEADQYIAGCIILAAAPCTAMVFVGVISRWRPSLHPGQVSVNDSSCWCYSPRLSFWSVELFWGAVYCPLMPIIFIVIPYAGKPSASGSSASWEGMARATLPRAPVSMTACWLPGGADLRIPGR